MMVYPPYGQWVQQPIVVQQSFTQSGQQQQAVATQSIMASTPTNQSISQTINQSMNQTMNQTLNPSMTIAQTTNPTMNQLISHSNGQQMNQTISFRGFSPVHTSIQPSGQPLNSQMLPPPEQQNSRWIAVPMNQSINQTLNPTITQPVPMTLVQVPMQSTHQMHVQHMNQPISMIQPALPTQINQTVNQPILQSINSSANASCNSMNLAQQAEQALGQGLAVKALVLSLQSIHRKPPASPNTSSSSLDHCVMVGRSVTNQLFSNMQSSPTTRDVLVEELLQAINQSNELFQECDQSIWTELRAVMSKAFSFHRDKRSVVRQSNNQTDNQGHFQLNYQPSIQQNHPFPQLITSSIMTQSPLHSPSSADQSIRSTFSNPLNISPLRNFNDSSNTQSVIQATVVSNNQSIHQSINQSIPFKFHIRTTNQLTSSTIKCKFCRREWPLSESRDAVSLVQRNRQLKSKRDHTPFCKANPEREKNLAKRRAKKNGKRKHHDHDPINSSMRHSDHLSNNVDEQSESSSSLACSDEELEQNIKSDSHY